MYTFLQYVTDLLVLDKKLAYISSTVYAGSPLNGWQITLLVGGGMFLGSVIGVAVIALVRGRKLGKLALHHIEHNILAYN